METFILAFALAVAVIMLGLLVRNEWVYRKRIAWIDLTSAYFRATYPAPKRPEDLARGSNEHVRLMQLLGDYHTMVFKFWVFDLRQFATDTETYDKVVAWRDAQK